MLLMFYNISRLLVSLVYFDEVKIFVLVSYAMYFVF